MSESNEHGEKVTSPELESRTNRGLSYGEDKERAECEKRRKPSGNTAFYSIEREAIALRRLRWVSAEQSASESVDHTATQLRGQWAPKIKSREELSTEMKLAQYARPSEETPERKPTFPWIWRLFGR